ncbi:MAG: helicase-exonuclease AddAB subunit AddB [Thermoanaerobacterales bacterium]|nr:helicase-exonuclease AddAB subunit AddB [Thermoanaerobacterales bacterium]
MSLRLILGRAGTGKTRRCLDEIRAALHRSADGPPLIFLVPEQATFQTEYALVTSPGLGGTVRAQVTSFRRLAHRVLQETGGAVRPHLSDLAKHMLLRALLEELRPRLRAFGRAANQPGFAGLVGHALSEIKVYGLTSSHLISAAQDLAGHSPDPLADKLTDLALLHDALEQVLAGRYTDPDDYLHLLAESLPRAASLNGAVFWVDGFAGFTPQEYAVLEQLLRCAPQVNLALCLDGRYADEPPGETDVFYPTRTTLARVRALAAEQGVPEEPPLILDNGTPPRFAGAPALAHLERCFYVRPAPAEKKAGPGEVTLVSAANRRAEVEGAAREIIRLVRDHGFRWRDTAVVLRDLEGYHELIACVFTDYGIPFFIDHKRPVLHHPLVELIRAALEVAVTGWNFEPLFRYLKADLAPLTRDEVDRLENYVLAHGIRGDRWTDGRPWTYRRRFTLAGEGEDRAPSPEEAAELAAINNARQRAIGALHAFCRSAAESRDVLGLTSALFRLLEELEVPAGIEAWRREAEASGRLEEAQEHAQIWDGVLDVLDQMVQALGERSLSLADYARVLDSGIEALRLGLIPPALDQVLVGSLERSRSPEIQAAFVLGAVDGVLPARSAEDALLNDAERQRLEEIGLELAPGARRRLLNEQYLVYIALTRASRYLWISYPLADEEGNALAPSPVIERIRRLLPGVRVSVCFTAPTGGDDTAFVTRPGPTLAYLVDRLRAARDGEAIHPIWWAAYDWLLSRPAWAPALRRATAALFHVNQDSRLHPDTAARLFGRPIRASVSRFERYRACPFAHFVEHGLRLRERPVQRLAPPDLGRFFHAALEQFAGQLMREGREWGDLTAAECAALTDCIVAGLAPQLQSEILLSTARHRYLTGKLQRTVERAAMVLGEHARRGLFRPVALELAFGPDTPLGPLRLPGAELAGRIDRIDVARTPSGFLLRVIDYKSGRARLTIPEMEHGLKIQLLTYLDIALARARNILGISNIAVLPAGILYFTVQNPLLHDHGPLQGTELERRLLRRLRMDGYVLADPKAVALMDREARTVSDLIPVHLTRDGFGANSRVLSGEQFELLRRHLHALLTETARDIADGVVDIAPYRLGDETACRYCPYPAVCRFDRQLRENFFRILREEPPEAFWSRLRRRYSGEGGESGNDA